ncbi:MULTISPECIES: hypothetical protein [Escherichia]|uniref:hypothetical protein n=1 Tax=Escherichia TaxID=561 RepID=UPI0007747D7F|nr:MULTISPECIES: hypothetical protein [Escherichia]EFP0198725.1 hypothetical protein [Escherichia coli]EJH1685708.1 hypothetical protein [Escherichia coli]EJN3746378.1 hypothetical protein [Escherichia coli]EJN3789893.1 hypothetical protein [Escherichia coli]KXM81404.1 hypothetical protein AUS31_27190 [Escherichia coli]
MAERRYGLAGRGWDRRNLSISTGFRRASAVLLQYHMKQQSAALHAADAASVNLSQNKKPTNLVVKKSKSCNGTGFQFAAVRLPWFCLRDKLNIRFIFIRLELMW